MNYIPIDSIWNQTRPILSSTLSVIWKYIPNFQEVVTTSAVQSGVNTIFGSALTFKNAAAGSIVRDISKTPSVVVNAYEKVYIGHSNHTYDDGTSIAQYAKVACKTTIVGGTYYLHGEGHVEDASRAANVICETPNRIMHLAAMERQDGNKTNTPYFSYFMDHYSNEWVAQSIVGGIPKVLIMDTVGKYIGATGIVNCVKYYTTMSLSHSIGSVLPAFHASITDSITNALVINGDFSRVKLPGFQEYYRALDLRQTDPFLIKTSKIIAIPCLLVSDFTSKFAGEVVSTYIFTPLARGILDLGQKVTSYVDLEEISSQIKTLYSNSEISFEGMISSISKLYKDSEFSSNNHQDENVEHLNLAGLENLKANEEL